MDRLSKFISKHWPSILLVIYMLKTQFHADRQTDFMVLLILGGLSVLKIILNSIYEETTEKKLKKLYKETEDKLAMQAEQYTNSISEVYESLNGYTKQLQEQIDGNHKTVDVALAKITKATEEELVKIKTDMGQINLSQGIKGGQKQKIFF